MKKVYFAGSIRAGREDASLYQEIISHIQETDIVLTEHIGDLSKTPVIKDENYDKNIYIQDMAWLEECDIVIAECTRPSLGVGYEMAYAEKIGKEVHIFYRPNETSLSAMLSGNEYFHIHPYTTKKELLDEIDLLLQ